MNNQQSIVASRFSLIQHWRSIAALIALLSSVCGAADAQTYVRYESNVTTQQIRLSYDSSSCLTIIPPGILGDYEYVQRAKCGGTSLDAQRWILSSNAARGFRIHPHGRQDMCLDLDDAGTKGRLLLWKCSSRSKWQQWAIIPVDYMAGTPQYALMNVGLMESMGSAEPLVLTRLTSVADIYADPLKMNVPGMRNLRAGDAQPNNPTQYWTSPEIGCYLEQGKHVVGWEIRETQVPGRTPVTATNPWCK